MLQANECTYNAFKFAEVIVLEDDPFHLREIENSIKDFGNVEVVTASDLIEFHNLLGTKDFDVASIDCDIEGHRICSQVLDTLNRETPNIGKIIYTAHDEERDCAERKGVDEFVLKGEDSLEYAEKMMTQINNKQIKKIANFLKIHGANLNFVEVTEYDKEIYANRLYELSYQYIFQCFLVGGEYYQLKSLLLKRGCWEEFDVKGYSSLSWIEKVKKAIQFSCLSIEELGLILQIEKTNLKKILSGNYEINISPLSIFERLDAFLSVVGYLLKISRYEPSLIPLFLDSKRLYSYSLNMPPWNDLGLKNFLMTEGPTGLTKSMKWIRSR